MTVAIPPPHARALRPASPHSSAYARVPSCAAHLVSYATPPAARPRSLPQNCNNLMGAAWLAAKRAPAPSYLALSSLRRQRASLFSVG